jgi:hypothetical protein
MITKTKQPSKKRTNGRAKTRGSMPAEDAEMVA